MLAPTHEQFVARLRERGAAFAAGRCAGKSGLMEAQVSRILDGTLFAIPPGTTCAKVESRPLTREMLEQAARDLTEKADARERADMEYVAWLCRSIWEKHAP